MSGFLMTDVNYHILVLLVLIISGIASMLLEVEAISFGLLVKVDK